MTEQEANRIEQQRLDEGYLNVLTSIKRTGNVRNKVIEMLMQRGLIHFHGPDESCQYNHYRLTPAGNLMLTKLEKKARQATTHTRG